MSNVSRPIDVVEKQEKVSVALISICQEMKGDFCSAALIAWSRCDLDNRALIISFLTHHLFRKTSSNWHIFVYKYNSGSYFIIFIFQNKCSMLPWLLLQFIPFHRTNINETAAWFVLFSFSFCLHSLLCSFKLLLHSMYPFDLILKAECTDIKYKCVRKDRKW